MKTELQRDIYTVSRLNTEVRRCLERQFATIWLSGEISNFVCPASGHFYLTLKDNSAQVRCAMFRGKNRHLTFLPENGMQVTVQANVSVYEGRGDYQLIIEHMEQAGEGALLRAYEALKKQLGSKGLFDPEHKKPIPEFPQTIGVITSATGAAIRDILSVIQRRFPLMRVIIYPTSVQGEQAPGEIIQALQIALEEKVCDVLLLARGGGSMEDLWAFNNEDLAYEIFNADIPIVSGVGHEIDFTIADFVADERAPTPTAAAELVTPDGEQLADNFASFALRLIELVQQTIQQHRVQITHLRKRLRHPGDRLREQAQRLDGLCEKLYFLMHRQQNTLRQNLHAQRAALMQQHPNHIIDALRHRWSQLAHRLPIAGQHVCQRLRNQFALHLAKLDTVSPLATLQRGYAIASLDSTGKLLTSTKDAHHDDQLTLSLADGKLACKVTGR